MKSPGFIGLGFFIFCSNQLLAQVVTTDSIYSKIDLQEIVISAKTGFDREKLAKPFSSVEEYLQGSEKVNLIKRGSYAWEPTINNMSTERISVTIDGMKIFHACTDRMDPVTSYVETVNLDKVKLGNGFDANPNASNHIGGSLDLKLNKTGFCDEGLNINVNSGYESNSNLRILGADVSYANPRFYLNSGLFTRKSGNYYAGGNKEIAFSQFAKSNIFTNWGYVIANRKAIEGTIIYDHATHVGYPALTMDVRKAEGLITSLSYTVEKPFQFFYKWESKIYYNNIVHVMDDTQRPNVPMHMDMPGKSRTGGFYSTLNGQNGKHRYAFNWDAYYNQSYAEMTMYPETAGEIPMFMLTWPDIRTLNTGLFAVDELRLNEVHTFRLSAKGSFQRDGIFSDFGLRTLRGYYPGIASYRNRLIGNVAGRYQFRRNDWEAILNAGYGNRAPSVSEAYGFYLFNTFDAYDYLGNLHLKPESSAEAGLSVEWKKRLFDIKADVTYFYFSNYIIGKPNTDLHYMTIGATGVKVYENLPHATLLNASVVLKYWLTENLAWNSRILYSRGQDNKKSNLPLIAPLIYDTSLSLKKEKFIAEAGLAGAGRQIHFSPEYGEDETKDYLIVNISAGYTFKAGKTIFNLKAGVENLFDAYYSTYSDWKNIPRKGRNLFINLGINI